MAAPGAQSLSAIDPFGSQSIAPRGPPLVHVRGLLPKEHAGHELKRVLPSRIECATPEVLQGIEIGVGWQMHPLRL